jgi:hypothetical protein
MDNGLTQAQAAEVITHLAFYVGWPNAMSALPVAKDVFEKRPKSLTLKCHEQPIESRPAIARARISSR